MESSLLNEPEILNYRRITKFAVERIITEQKGKKIANLEYKIEQ
jgi:hypothetical protein